MCKLRFYKINMIYVFKGGGGLNNIIFWIVLFFLNVFLFLCVCKLFMKLCMMCFNEKVLFYYENYIYKVV